MNKTQPKEEKLKRTQKRNGKPIRQNRPGYKKKVIKIVGLIPFRRKGRKIKGKEYIKNEKAKKV